VAKRLQLSVLALNRSDFTALVKEAAVAGSFRPLPKRSLLLLKATGPRWHTAPAKRLEADSEEYQLIRRWIAAACPSANRPIRS